jgi:hypothetical protein
MQRLRAAALLCALLCAHAAPCTRTFANMTTCAVLNGVPANGTQLEISATNKIQSVVTTMYASHAVWGRSPSDACRAVFYAYNCALLLEARSGIAGDGPYMYAGVCDAAGGHMRPCRAWCEQFYWVCYGLLPEFLVDNQCAGTSYSGECFGDAGVRGMRTAEPPAPPSGTFSNGFSLAAPRRSGAWAALALAALAVSLQKQNN